MDDNKNKDKHIEHSDIWRTRVYTTKPETDAAELDPAELARRFDTLQEEFRRAHGAQATPAQTPYPQQGPQQPRMEQQPGLPGQRQPQGQQPHPQQGSQQPRTEQQPGLPGQRQPQGQQPHPQQGQQQPRAAQRPEQPGQPGQRQPQGQQPHPQQGQQQPRTEQRPEQPGQPGQRQPQGQQPHPQQGPQQPRAAQQPGQRQPQGQQPHPQQGSQQPRTEQQPGQRQPQGQQPHPQQEQQQPTSSPQDIALTLDAIFAQDEESGKQRKSRLEAHRNGDKGGGSQRRQNSDAGDRDRKRQNGKGTGMEKSANKNGKNKRKKKKQSIGAKILKWAISVIVILVLAVGLVGGIYVYSIVKDMPRYSTADLDASLKVMSTIYDDQGQPMKNIYMPEGQRTLATYEQLPKNLVNALVAIEDKTFWTHKGFNIIRIAGAVLESVRGGGAISGTSTITQQLARNIWLIDQRTERSLTRKIKEAFYARELEANLSKEEILTAYLNTIGLGNHSYGIAAAAENYYGKKVEDLDLIESAALAALPASPSVFSMIATVTPGEVAPDDPRIILSGSQYTYLYSDAIEPRLKLVLSEMLAQGYITQKEYDDAMADNLRSHLHPKDIEIDSNSDFFVSHAIDQVADDLLKSDPGLVSRDEAMQKIYSGGLDIYTTFNQRAQNIATEEFNNPENFPAVAPNGSDYDDLKNVRGESGNILVFSHDYMFETRDDGDWFHLIADRNAFPYAWKEGEAEADFSLREDGSMVIYGGASKRLAIYRTEGAGGPDINLEFKDYYVIRDEVWYIAKGGIITIPAEYKGIDEAGNMILSKKFFGSEHDIFTTDENGELWISPDHFTTRQEVIQPQTGFVLIDHTNGQLKAMIGGRDIKGQFQFNRALSPQPPGSTIKPIGVYGPAIEMSANGEAVGSDIPTYGNYWTPVSIVIDEEMEYRGRKWPKNWYSGFRGPQTMRYCIENSVNVTAVKAQLAIGDQRSISFLKKLGITTIVEEGASNDLTPAALALGGMTQGLTPLENASAYGTFANSGVHITPITYTLVKDKRGNVLLDGTPEQTQAMNSGTAFIVNDMLRTTITNGIAGAAAVQGTSIAGKTGTTSDYYDAWFVGNTPKYSASVWIGCDVDIRLSQGSAAASKMFSTVMTRIIEGEDQGEYPAQPENVVSASVSTKPTNNPNAQKNYTDYFIAGTAPEYVDLGVEQVEICLDSGLLATEWCEHREMREFSTINKVDANGNPTPQAPQYYCNLHNLDPQRYPVAPGAQLYSQAPDLRNKVEARARALLERVNLVFGEAFEAYDETVEAGRIISQNPEPGEWINQGFKVNVTISLGPDPVTQTPDLSGLTEGEARTLLDAAGLVMSKIEEYHDSIAAGMVIGQDPAPGTAANRGDAIAVRISVGPDPATAIPPATSPPPATPAQDSTSTRFVAPIGKKRK